MSSEPVEIRCRACGRLTLIDAEPAEQFTAACDACNEELVGRYREDGTIVWS